MNMSVSFREAGYRKFTVQERSIRICLLQNI